MSNTYLQELENQSTAQKILSGKASADTAVVHSQEDQSTDVLKSKSDDVLKKTFHDVFRLYNAFLDEKDSLNPSRWVYFQSGQRHFFEGQYQGKASEAFIDLATRLALTHKYYFEKLRAAFYDSLGISFDRTKYSSVTAFRKSAFDEKAKKLFIDQIYTIFEEVQTASYEYLNSLCLSQLEKKYGFYIVENSNSLSYFDVINASDEDLEGVLKKLQISHDGLTLHNEEIMSCYLHDLRLARKKILAEREAVVAELKKVKKDIHHFAEAMGFKSRIVHLKKRNKEKEAKRIGAHFTTYKLFKESEVSPISDEKKHRRAVKARNEKWAINVASVVSVADTCVALMGALGLCVVSPIFYIFLPLVAISGLITNYLFMKDDTYEALNQYSFDNIYKNKAGEEVSENYKKVIQFVGLASIATGFVMGALALVETKAFLALTLGKILPMIVCTAIAAFPAVAMAIGMTCILYIAISDFIKEKRWLEIKDYFREALLLDCKMSLGWRCVNILAWAICDLPKVLFGIAACAFFTVVSFGMLHSTGIEALKIITSGKIAETLASKISTYAAGINSGTKFLFSLDKVLSLLSGIVLFRHMKRNVIKFLACITIIPALYASIAYRDGCKGLFKDIDRHVHAGSFTDFDADKKQAHQQNSMQRASGSVKSITRGLEVGAVITDGTAAAGLFASSPSSRRFFSPAVVADVTMIETGEHLQSAHKQPEIAPPTQSASMPSAA